MTVLGNYLVKPQHAKKGMHISTRFFGLILGTTIEGVTEPPDPP